MNSKKYLMALGYGCGILIFIFIYWVRNIEKTTDKLLSENGIETKGIIIYKIWRKRGTEYKFNFSSNGIVYTGWYRDYLHFNIGDSVSILYYKNNPQRYYRVLKVIPSSN